VIFGKLVVVSIFEPSPALVVREERTGDDGI